MGFDAVYDFTAGIADWKAAGLAVEGSEVGLTNVLAAARTDVPICRPEEVLGDVRARATAAGWDEALVVDCDNVVVGRIRGERWDHPDDLKVESVMELGPTTVRPDGSLIDLSKRMDDKGTKLVVVSDAQGHLLGVVLAEEARQIAAGVDPDVVWQDCDGCSGRAIPNAASDTVKIDD